MMVASAAVRALERAEESKRSICRDGDVDDDDDPDNLARVARLRKAYRDALLADLDFALERKVERDLWNFGFKERIERLQNGAKDKKNSRRADSQTLLSWTLRMATGFYTCLLHQICDAFDLILPFRCDIPYMESDADLMQITKTPQFSSCKYIVQDCLVHLGDLARYGRQSCRADSFYRQASDVSPDNGQPYNQLGLLRAARGDRLGAAYYHARGLAVVGPFLPAADNLARTLASATLRDSAIRKKVSDVDDTYLSSDARLSHQQYVNDYIAVHHRLRSNDLNDIDESISELNSALIALVATDEFDSRDLIQMCCLDLYAIYSVTNGYSLEFSQLGDNEKRAYLSLMKLIAGSLTSLLLPAHTRGSQELTSYSALPAIKILFEWIRSRPQVLEEQAFKSRPQLWPGLCTLLNNLQTLIEGFNGDEHQTIPLPENVELRGFLPINGSFSNFQFDNHNMSKRMVKSDVDNLLTAEQINSKLNNLLESNFLFKKKSWYFRSSNSESKTEKDEEFYRNLRIFRLINIGEWLCTYMKENGMDYFSFSVDSEKDQKIFTPIQNSLENFEVLKTIRELSLLREKHLNETSHQKNVHKEDDDASDFETKNDNANKNNIEDDVEEISPTIISEADFKEKVFEKRAGILKPQGSLEKARNEKSSRVCRMELTPPEFLKIPNDTIADTSDIQDTGSSSSTVSQDGTICSDIGSLLDPPVIVSEKVTKKEGKKTRTNVAMQAIMRKQEESSKQVKFLTPNTTPDSMNGACDTSVTENKDNMEKKKIIQPKVLKSLNSLPTDRKTGGILSLKDKSAGYPHLVNTISTTDNEKANNAANEESVSKVTSVDKAKDSNVDNQPKTKAIQNQKSVKPSDKKHVDNPNVFQQTAYTPWSNAYPNNATLSNEMPNVVKNESLPYDTWKLDSYKNQNNPGGYSYFPNYSNQKLQNSSITLPVVNPKEIDVRSVSMPKQRNSHLTHTDSPIKYPHYMNSPYDPKYYNCWNAPDKNLDFKNENTPQVNNATIRYMNSYNPGVSYNSMPDRNFPNMPVNNRIYNDNQTQSAAQNWWNSMDPKPVFETDYQNLPVNMANFSLNSQQMMPNMGNYNFVQTNQQPMMNHSQNKTVMKNSPPFPKYNETMNPDAYKVQPPPYNPNMGFNPYQPSNFGTGVFSPQQNLPIGNNFLNRDPYGGQVGVSNPAAFTSDAHKPSKDNLNPSHTFNADIPEFVPKIKETFGSEDMTLKQTSVPGSTNTYSLFSGPESPWQTKKFKSPPDNTSWSGSVQSPLERLLEQQKQFKYPSSNDS